MLLELINLKYRYKNLQNDLERANDRISSMNINWNKYQTKAQLYDKLEMILGEKKADLLIEEYNKQLIKRNEERKLYKKKRIER